MKKSQIELLKKLINAQAKDFCIWEYEDVYIPYVQEQLRLLHQIVECEDKMDLAELEARVNNYIRDIVDDRV